MKEKIQAIYNKHAQKLQDMKNNRADEIDSMTDAEMKLADSNIQILASVLSDIFHMLQEPDTHAEQVAEKRINDLREFILKYKSKSEYKQAALLFIHLFTTKKEEDADK